MIELKLWFRGDVMVAVESVPIDDAQLWNRLISPDRSDMPLEAARYFLSLEFNASDRNRMHELAQRNQAGEMTPTDEAALASYRRVGIQLDILRAKAKLSLKSNDSAHT